jgi:hypothetical protein
MPRRSSKGAVPHGRRGSVPVDPKRAPVARRIPRRFGCLSLSTIFAVIFAIEYKKFIFSVFLVVIIVVSKVQKEAHGAPVCPSRIGYPQVVRWTVQVLRIRRSLSVVQQVTQFDEMGRER